MLSREEAACSRGRRHLEQTVVAPKTCTSVRFSIQLDFVT